MRAYADANPGNDHLRELADKLDAAVADSFGGKTASGRCWAHGRAHAALGARLRARTGYERSSAPHRRPEDSRLPALAEGDVDRPDYLERMAQAAENTPDYEIPPFLDRRKPK
jgi:hypothetical protein